MSSFTIWVSLKFLGGSEMVMVMVVCMYGPRMNILSKGFDNVLSMPLSKQWAKDLFLVDGRFIVYFISFYGSDEGVGGIGISYRVGG